MRQKKIKLATLIESEIASGIAIILTFIIALAMANIDITSDFYQDVIFLPVTIDFANFSFETTTLQVVNDGLMTLFFLFIGMELKYQLVCGDYRDKKTLIVPSFAAIGGIIVPAIVYWFFNKGYDSIKGWAIPIATDTAFMLGLVSLFGTAISNKVRSFILSFSLIDDALALIILAVFYTTNINFIALFLSIGIIFILIILNLNGIQRNSIYLMIGALLWLFMVESGCHGTLSGAILALMIPIKIDDKINPSFHRLERILRPLVCFMVLPCFVFVNSGVGLESMSIDVLTTPISLGVMAGLLIGKPIGLFGFSWIAVKLKFGRLPNKINWPLLYAVSVLGGIGFTLSLFIGDLTFEISEPNYSMRIGVIVGSILSAVHGCCYLFFLKRKWCED